MSEFEILDGVLAHLEALLAGLEPKVFDAAGAARLVEGFARGERLCAAGKGLAARRVEECGTWKREGFRSGAHWLADQSGVTVGAAEQALRTARALDELPATEAAFRAGELSEVQAGEISGAALGDPASEAALLAAAASASVKALRGQCRQVRAASVVDDREWARRQHGARRLDRWTDELGMDCGHWRLAPGVAASVHVALEDEIDQLWNVARREGRREPRAAYAADALVNLITRGPCKAPEVKMLLDHAALERGYVADGERCEITGIGPVPVTVARALFQDSRVSLLVREGDDVRTVTSMKPTIPRRIKRHLEARSSACENGGCGNTGFLQIDHIMPREDHGPTRLENLWRLCTHCHNLKTYRGWQVTTNEHGHRQLVPP